mgnify:CR=1 FL=1
MKILFATTNPAKIIKYFGINNASSEDMNKNVEVLIIKDFNLNLEVNENGKNAIENACIKAKAYYETTGITTIGMDNNLFIEELPEEKQPGTHVRRVNGKTLDDNEMIEYYSGLIKKYGGVVKGKWVYGMVVCSEKGESEYMWSRDNFLFTDKPCKKRNPGYPLDSLAVSLSKRRYLAYIAKEEEERRIAAELARQQKRAAVVAYAKQFVGNPYVYGGTSLTRGTDCSGFVMSVYNHFGVSLPHSSYSMRRVGHKVSLRDIQPGDIVCFSGHVGIYAGNGQIVNAINERKGIGMSDLYARKVITVRRIF